MQNLGKQGSIFLLLNKAMSYCCWQPQPGTLENFTVAGRVYSLQELFTTDKGTRGTSSRRLPLSACQWPVLPALQPAPLSGQRCPLAFGWELRTAKMLLLGPGLLLTVTQTNSNGDYPHSKREGTVSTKDLSNRAPQPAVGPEDNWNTLLTHHPKGQNHKVITQPNAFVL